MPVGNAEFIENGYQPGRRGQEDLPQCSIIGLLGHAPFLPAKQVAHKMSSPEDLLPHTLKASRPIEVLGASESSQLRSGIAVLYHFKGETAHAGVLAQGVGGWVVIPMGFHLQRDTEIPIDLNLVSPLEPLQSTLPEREPHVPFAPRVICRAGTIVLQRSDDDPTRYRLFEVLEDVIREHGASAPDVARLLAMNPDGSRTQTIETMDLRNVVTLRSIVIEAEAQYRYPPDRFWYIASLPIITNWKSSVAATASFPTKSLNGIVTIALADGKLSITMDALERPLFADEPKGISTRTVYRKLVEGSLTPDDVAVPTWRLGDVQFTGVAMSSDVEYAQFKFHAVSLTQEYSEGIVSATREVFRGLDYQVFSDRLIPEGLNTWDFLTARNAYKVKIFGREAVIVQAEPGYLALIHEGAPLTRDELEDVQTVLQYLCGKRGQHLSTETFDDFRRLTFEYRERSAPTSIALPPIRLDPWSNENAECLGREFAVMVEASRKLRGKSPNGIAAAFHHYFEGVNSSYAVSRTLMLAVAIDALIAAYVGNQRQALIFEKAVFRKIARPLKKAAKDALAAANIGKAQAASFLGKIDNLNFASAAQRQGMFWDELGISLTDDEADVLRSRHEVVHEGHLGFEHTADDLWDNYRRSNLLATLFNRAMLILLGWTGPCLDLTDMERKAEIPLRSVKVRSDA